MLARLLAWLLLAGQCPQVHLASSPEVVAQLAAQKLLGRLLLEELLDRLPAQAPQTGQVPRTYPARLPQQSQLGQLLAQLRLAGLRARALLAGLLPQGPLARLSALVLVQQPGRVLRVQLSAQGLPAGLPERAPLAGRRPQEHLAMLSSLPNYSVRSPFDHSLEHCSPILVPLMAGLSQGVVRTVYGRLQASCPLFSTQKIARNPLHVERASQPCGELIW